MQSDLIARQVAELGPWFQNLHLPGDIQTSPQHFLGDFPRYKWQQIAHLLPKDMQGWRVLDIGCNAGYYSFELAKRGAHVTAIDSDGHYLRQAEWAARLLQLEHQIDFRHMAVYQLINERQEYDLVWFMGVLHQLRYPLLALDIVRKCCGQQMVFQTMTMPGDDVFKVAEDYDLEQREVMNAPGWPKMAFIEHGIAGDQGSWWTPNHAGVEALLRSAGFADIDRIAPEVYSCRISSMPAFRKDLDAVSRLSH